MVLEVKVKWWAQKGDHRNTDRRQTDQTNERTNRFKGSIMFWRACYFDIMQKWILHWRRGNARCPCPHVYFVYLAHFVMLCEIVPKGDFKWFSTSNNNNNSHKTPKIRCTPEMCIRFRLQMHYIFIYMGNWYDRWSFIFSSCFFVVVCCGSFNLLGISHLIWYVISISLGLVWTFPSIMCQVVNVILLFFFSCLPFPHLASGSGMLYLPFANFVVVRTRFIHSFHWSFAFQVGPLLVCVPCCCSLALIQCYLCLPGWLFSGWLKWKAVPRKSTTSTIASGFLSFVDCM